MPIQSFKGDLASALFDGDRSHKAIKRFPPELIRTAQRKLDLLEHATRLDDLRIPPGNRLEALQGDRQGQHSIRVNDQWRICFVWRDGEAFSVELVDYH